MTEPPVVNIRALPESAHAAIPDRSLLVLGVDLGTTSGYCYRYHDKVTGEPTSKIHLGLWDLSAGNFDSGAVRFARLRRLLGLLGPGLIGYEDAKVQVNDLSGLGGPRAKVVGTILINLRMSELFGAFKATLAAWSEEHDVPAQGFPVGTIKKRATGKGNANKEAIVAAFLKDLSLDLDPETDGIDNAADAFYIYSLAVEQVLPGVLTKKDG